MNPQLRIHWVESISVFPFNDIQSPEAQSDTPSEDDRLLKSRRQ